MTKISLFLLIMAILLLTTGCSYKIIKIEEGKDKNINIESLNSNTPETDETNKKTSDLNNESLVAPKSTDEKRDQAPSKNTESKSEEGSNTQTLNRTDDLIIHYAKSLVIFEELEKFIESNKSFVNLRIEHINNRINILNSSILVEFTHPEDLNMNYYITKWNEIINLYIEEHKRDLDSSNTTLSFLNRRQIDNNRLLSLYSQFRDYLLKNPQTVTIEKEYNRVLDVYNSSYINYFTTTKDGINQVMSTFEESLDAFDKHYKNNDSQIAQLVSALSTVFSAQINQYKPYNPTSQGSYASIPQPSLNVPIHCTIDHDQFQSLVSCY